MNLTKGILAVLVALALVVGAYGFGFAAEDDIVNEADIYLPEQTYIVQNNIVSEPLDGVKVSSIADSPAVAGERILIDMENDDADANNEIETGEGYENIVATDEIVNPGTGAPSMLLPVGVCLVALGCIPVLYKKEK